MIKTQYIRLDMTPGGTPPVFFCSQYDVGRPLGMVVYNGGEAVDLSTYTCTIEATRTDGTAITTAVTTDDNIGAFVTTATMTNKADKYTAKLVIVDEGGNRIASLAFVMMVTPKTMDENAESIEEDKSLYQQYTETVQTLISEVKADLNAEENRAKADLKAEENRAKAAEATLQSNINAEATARQNADRALQTAINTEASARATADNGLQAQINQIVAPSGAAPSAAEVQNARIGADNVTYPTLGDAIRGQVTDLKRDLSIINPTANITWELGKGISGSGDVNNNQYTALSNDIPCEPGDFFITTSPTVDANNKFLVYYIAQYNGDTFISRTELTSSIRSIVIGGNTTKIRVAFGRYSSSQTPISQQDIANYVAVEFIRKAASKADINLQFRNTVLNKYTDIGTDINNITENSFVFSPEGTANNPTTTGGYFIQTILYNTSGTAAMQVAYKYDVGLCYYRRKVNGSWQRWILNTAPANPTRPVYYAFGDSLTYGAVWTSKEEAPYYQITQASFENRIPTRIANAIGAADSFSNKGVGGAYFVGTGTNKIITAIQNQDLSNAKIITIAGGRNDSENPLGDKTSTSGDGTICGAIREILDYVTTNHKKLQIVWIGVTPNTSNNATVFTRVFAGGWSLNSFDEKVSELCAEYGVPYVGWKSCTYIRHWADYSGAGGVYSHPNNEESYLQMGNYIAGRVAQYYRG